jgi:hypothetical protein
MSGVTDRSPTSRPRGVVCANGGGVQSATAARQCSERADCPRRSCTPNLLSVDREVRRNFVQGHLAFVVRRMVMSAACSRPLTTPGASSSHGSLIRLSSRSWR